MNKFMQEAIKIAEKSIQENEGGPFGCVIVKDGKIIARGHNQVIKKNNPTLHGEMVAISKACKKLKNFDLSGCELYTTGEPCPMCLCAILWANISKVYYGCSIYDAEKIGFRDKKFYNFFKNKNENKNEKFIKQLDRNETLKLYKDYINLKNKTPY